MTVVSMPTRSIRGAGGAADTFVGRIERHAHRLVPERVIA